MSRNRYYDRSEKFSAVPFWVSDRITDSGAIHLYVILKRYSNQDGVSWPGQDRLAAHMGCSTRSVRRAIGVLVDANILYTEQHRGAGGLLESTDYVLLPEGGKPEADRRTPVADGVTPQEAPAPPPSDTGVHQPSDTGVLRTRSRREPDPVQTEPAARTVFGSDPSWRKPHPKKHPDRHHGHWFCTDNLCVTEERRATWERRLRAAQLPYNPETIKTLVREVEADYQAALAGEADPIGDHPMLFLEKAFTEALRNDTEMVS